MRYRATLAPVATLILLPLLGVACTVLSTGPLASLDSARARWARRGPAAYSFTLTRGCECLREVSGPVAIVVRNGTVTSRQYVHSGAAVDSEYAAQFPAIEGLFEIIDKEIRAGTKPLDVRYDAALGYPIRIVAGNVSIDAGVIYSVIDFRPE
jgi:hypothetical protein